ncbi:hypothetical protein [Halomonas sp. H5]|uniref:hypothetical protein n=1 Tax=Halomonas sp. H5 TaxID=3423910 RepID=UPI003D36B554
MEPAQYPTSADAASANTLGTTASPLLAGFSMTLIGLIAGHASPATAMKWPDLTLAVLFGATLSFVLSVQFIVVARKFNLTKEEYKSRTPALDPDVRKERYGVVMRDLCSWIERARLLFNLGLGLLFLGLAGVMLPPSPSCLRYSVVVLPILAFLGEMAWFFVDFCRSREFQKSLKEKKNAA